MLPNHVLADVVGWLRFYDLDALLVTDARCSDLALSAASRIRVFDFSEFNFTFFFNDRVVIYNMKDGKIRSGRTELEFRDKAELANFIPTAMRNCVLGSLDLFYDGSLAPMKEVVNTIVIKEALYLHANTFVNLHALVEFTLSFRSVKKVRVCCIGSHEKDLVDLFGRHGFGQLDVGQHGDWVSFVSL